MAKTVWHSRVSRADAAQHNASARLLPLRLLQSQLAERLDCGRQRRLPPVEEQRGVDLRPWLLPEAGHGRALELRGVARAAERGEEVRRVEVLEEVATVEDLVVRHEVDPLARPLVQPASDDLPRVREDGRCVE
eukprot:scaffold39753_cov65-Phaeocystis_antarctica.AAC.8